MAREASVPGFPEILEALPYLTPNELRMLKHRMDSYLLKKDVLLHLPEELRLYILEDLEIDDVWACLNVSRSWRTLMQQDSVVRTLSRIHYPGLRKMLECRYDPRMAMAGNELDQDACEALSATHRRAFVRAVNRSIRRRHGTISSLYSHRWWHRSDTGEADGAERLLPADEWRGKFVLQAPGSDDGVRYQPARLPSPLPANLPRPQRQKYHSGRLASQFDVDDPRGRFVVDDLSLRVRRRFQPPAQQVGSCGLLALGDTLMVCGRGNRLYVYNMLQPEQSCHSLALPGLINQDCVATAGRHVVGMLSSHESVKIFDWAVDGQLHDYEVSEPATFAREACRYLKNSHKPVLVAHPFAKGVMYMIFGDIPIYPIYEDEEYDGELSSKKGMGTVVFEIVDGRFEATFAARSPGIRLDWGTNQDIAIFGAPTDSHGSIFIKRIAIYDDVDDHPSGQTRKSSPGSIILTFNIFTRSFQRLGEWHEAWPDWSGMKPHFWDRLCAKVYSHSQGLRFPNGAQSPVLPRLSVPHIIPICRTLSEGRECNARTEAHEMYPSKFRTPTCCFPQLGAEIKELSAWGTTSASLPLDVDFLDNIYYPCDSLYAITSDPEFHSYDTIGSAPNDEDDRGITIFGDDDFLITVGGAGYSAWCFAPAADAPNEAENVEK
ncbi:hypothetical protein MAPG_00811 [Magnaporthiopsis poae ATCC 64411]|uniref:F-box domain-containing protein n=1 Tax=Magnaporthiopsis poae (strain ATCC 64411 / 73-15) TaxID=644358 RepID=A0A0C4DM10_MAGP6|nr:hypothetical protein MAPG_00811 [Magnaporthiopsis poae ATCC 64411]